MLLVTDLVDMLTELEALARANDVADYEGQPHRWDDEFDRLGRRLVTELHERLPLRPPSLPWWLMLVGLPNAAAARELGIPARSLTANAAILSDDQLAAAASLVGSQFVKRWGRLFARLANNVDWGFLAALTRGMVSQEAVDLAWRSVCRTMRDHDRMLALTSGTLPWEPLPVTPAPVAEPTAPRDPATAPMARPTLQPLRCPQCGTTWRPRRPQPVKCPRCQYRFGWGL